MRRMVEFMAVFTVAATLTMAGCSDAPSPAAPEPDQASFFAHEPAPGFGALRRLAPLPTDVSAMQTMGAEGGSIHLPEAGIRFVVPRGALTEPVEITMTAVAGRAMAVEFEPHGLHFLESAQIHVDPSDTEAAALLSLPEAQRGPRTRLDHFLGVYYQGDPALGVEPLETIETYLIDDAIVFSVEHFSGYVCASG